MGRVCGIRVLGCPGRPSEFVVSESVGTPPGRLASFELKSGWVGWGEGASQPLWQEQKYVCPNSKECSDVKGNVHLGVLRNSSCSDDSWVWMCLLAGLWVQTWVPSLCVCIYTCMYVHMCVCARQALSCTYPHFLLPYLAFYPLHLGVFKCLSHYTAGMDLWVCCCLEVDTCLRRVCRSVPDKESGAVRGPLYTDGVSWVFLPRWRRAAWAPLQLSWVSLHFFRITASCSYCGSVSIRVLAQCHDNYFEESKKNMCFLTKHFFLLFFFWEYNQHILFSLFLVKIKNENKGSVLVFLLILPDLCQIFVILFWLRITIESLWRLYTIFIGF